MQPVGRRININPGQTLLDASRAAGVGIISLCGGESWCNSCLVRIASGEMNPPSQSEIESIGQGKICQGYRLACQTMPLTDIRVDIPQESLSPPQRLQVEGRDFDVPRAPIVRVVDLDLFPPTIDDHRADTERITDGLETLGYPESHLELTVLEIISGLLRKFKWSARFVLRENEVIAVLPSNSMIYGISVDIGISIAPGAYIHLLPNIAGYVGADHSAVILSSEIWNTDETVLAIDIGTNTEISLVYEGKIFCCSCASGPAFEGAHITHGMRAAPGAIERVQIRDEEIKIFRIEDQAPVGICGSGILDVVAEMKTANLIDEKGAIRESSQFTRLDAKKLSELLLVPEDKSGNGQDITVSRKYRWIASSK